MTADPKNSRYSRYYTYIKPVIRSKSVRSYVTLILSLLAVAFFSVFAIRPTVGTIVSLQKSIDEQEKLLADVKAKISDLSAAKQNYDAIDEPTKLRLNNLLPYSTNVPPLIESLILLAETNDASLSALQFQPVEIEVSANKASKTSLQKEFLYTVNIRGDYANLMNYLVGLATINRLVSIESMNFNKPTESDLILSINAKSYYIKN